MFESFLITFRECLEMALIVGIILAYLKKTDKTQHNNVVYIGIAAGIAVSSFLAVLFNILWGSFEGAHEAIFEGILMLVAAGLLTSMIIWFLHQQKSIRKELEKHIESFWTKWSVMGIFLVVFLSILREGVETVLFMSAVFLNNSNTAQVILSALAGVFSAIALGYAIFVVGKKLNLHYFFLGSNLLLILFAAGLVAHGVHELQEASIIPIITEHIYDVNHIVNEKGTFGSIMKGLFGYNGNPSLLETISYFIYLGFIGIFANGILGKK